MDSFDLHLQSSTQYEVIHHVVSFVGEDASGQFGLLANHARMMTCLNFGLAWFRYENNEKEYLALPGAVVYFIDNQLTISTRHYFRHKEYRAIQMLIEKELHCEEENLSSIKESLHRLDEGMLKRLWDLKRQGNYGF
jgi:F-type H+-transporting ATPase subunit epsilon